MQGRRGEGKLGSCPGASTTTDLYDLQSIKVNIDVLSYYYNGLFGMLLNLASEEVILELVRTKCTPILL